MTFTANHQILKEGEAPDTHLVQGLRRSFNMAAGSGTVDFIHLSPDNYKVLKSLIVPYIKDPDDEILRFRGAVVETSPLVDPTHVMFIGKTKEKKNA